MPTDTARALTGRLVAAACERLGLPPPAGRRESRCSRYWMAMPFSHSVTIAPARIRICSRTILDFTRSPVPRKRCTTSLAHMSRMESR